MAATSTAYSRDVFTPNRGTRGRDACQGLNLVHVYKDTVVHTAFPIEVGSTVGREIDADETARILAEHAVLIDEPPRTR